MFLSSLFGRKKKEKEVHRSPQLSTSVLPELEPELAVDASNYFGKKKKVSRERVVVKKCWTYLQNIELKPNSTSASRTSNYVKEKREIDSKVNSWLASAHHEENIAEEHLRRRDESEVQQGGTGSKSKPQPQNETNRCPDIRHPSHINSPTKVSVDPVGKVPPDVPECVTNSTKNNSTSNIYPKIAKTNSTKTDLISNIYPNLTEPAVQLSSMFPHVYEHNNVCSTTSQEAGNKQHGLYPNVQKENIHLQIPKEIPTQSIHDIANEIPCEINMRLINAASTLKKIEDIQKEVNTAVNNHSHMEVSKFNHRFFKEHKVMKDTKDATNVKKIETFKQAKNCKTVTEQKIKKSIESIRLDNERLVMEKYFAKFRCYQGKFGDVVDCD